MNHRRSLFASAVPLALGLLGAGPALAAVPAVSVRVEGAHTTLLPARVVTAPAHGSITKGGTPSGDCPADSAAGALNTATHGKWGGSYYKGLGVDVGTILGTTLSYAKGSYWGFYVNDRFAAKGICETKLLPGESLLFAPVPAKGGTPLPIVLTAPRTVRAGTPFRVRTFVYPGKGDATRPVRTPRFVVHDNSGSTTSRQATSGRGVTTLTESSAGTVTIVATATGDIRSAAVTVKVTG
jgi:hypothetical protein